MDSKEKGLETIDLSGLYTTTIGGSQLDDTLTITSLNLSDTTIGPAYSVGAVGSSGTGLGLTGANGTTVWTSGTNWTTNTNGIDWSLGSSNIKPSGTIDLRGEDADIKVNGRSLMKAIESLEQRLNILVPNPELEKEWDELRELGERYRELEKKCKEKGDMWAKLKQMPPPEIK